jgi:6-phosphogluconolactonase
MLGANRSPSSSMGQAEIVSFSSDDALAAAAASAWLADVEASYKSGRKHLVALSGGRITKKFFAHIVSRVLSGFEPLKAVHFFWADERCLPPDHPESNFCLANELLFTPLAINASQVHRIHGEVAPGAGAQMAIEELRQVSGVAAPGLPVLDCVLLGMGEDGHVASLFPGDSATEGDLTSVFLPVQNSPKPPSNRVSLGHGMIANAREVWVLASGNGKQVALRESLSNFGQTPLARVVQRRPLTRIFSDISLA